MTADEIEVFYSLPKVEFNTYWVPCTWFISLLKEARKSKRIEDSEGVKLIMQVINYVISQYHMDADVNIIDSLIRYF